MQSTHLTVRRLSCALGLAVLALLAATYSVRAAYPPGTFPGAAPGGAFPDVVASTVVCHEGSTLPVAYGTASLVLSVPAGAFAACTQVTIYGVNAGAISPLLPPGYPLLYALALGWDGASQPASPLTLTIRDLAIPAGVAIFETTLSGVTALIGTDNAAGEVRFSFTRPKGVVVTTTASTASPTPSSPSASPTGSGEVGSATGTPATPPPTSTLPGDDAGWPVNGTIVILVALTGPAVMVVVEAARLRYRRSRSRR